MEHKSIEEFMAEYEKQPKTEPSKVVTQSTIDLYNNMMDVALGSEADDHQKFTALVTLKNRRDELVAKKLEQESSLR